MQHGVKRVNLSAQARETKLEKDRAKIAKYRALNKKVLERKAQKSYTIEDFNNTTIILDANPEFNAVWNYRRNIVSHLLEANAIERTETLNNDLLMSMEMMKRFPKTYWIWNHRRWCLEMLDTTHSADWNRELAIASKVLSMDSRNFHGWHYRRYVVSQMEKKACESEPKNVLKQLEINLREFKFTTEAINRSTSNFSAWHNRTTLIGKIFAILKTNEGCMQVFGNQKDPTLELFVSSLSLLRHELDLVKTGMFMDANDTSVWLYMQWLLTDDIFVRELSNDTYLEILQQSLVDVKELNSLEKADSLDGRENVWCLKTIILLQSLINRASETTVPDIANRDDEEINRVLSLLVELDPLRKGHYLDQLSKTAPILH